MLVFNCALFFHLEMHCVIGRVDNLMQRPAGSDWYGYMRTKVAPRAHISVIPSVST